VRKTLTTLIVAACMAVAGLSGCAATGGSTPAQTVFQAKSTFDTALTAAVAYKRLPACSATVKAPCSDRKVVDQLAKAGNAADVALDAAEMAVRTPGFGQDITSTAVSAASAAVRAFAAIAAQLGAK
jgi:hypothetical protein